MSRLEEKQTAPTPLAIDGATNLATRLREFQSLGAEVVRFFHAQTFSPGTHTSHEGVCQAFSEMLLRHWDLCVVLTFLRSDVEQPLQLFHVHISETLKADEVRAVAALFASEVDAAGTEQQVWLDTENKSGDSRTHADYFRALDAVGLRAAIGVPIYAREENPIGILVAMTAYPERLRAAIEGIRLISEPLVIAVGNGRRVEAIQEQRQHIDELVEELRKSNAALKDANQELQRVSLYRSLFLARMSHELRTPLTSILGFAEILLDQERLTDTQRRFCEKIQSSGLQLQTSLKQLVDLSRLEAGRTEIFLHEFSLRETLRESCAAVSPLARKREVLLDCYSPIDLASIVSDEGKLRQVFYNFLAHAISRSAAGQKVFVRAARSENGSFVATISDEGESVKDTSTIFESLDSLEPGAAGTNLNELGLSIARRLIDTLGGSVSLGANEPHGLTVSIDIPASL